jgi:isoamylase
MSSDRGCSQIGAVHENHSLVELLGGVKVHWHGVKLCAPFWGDDSHSLAVTLRSEEWLQLIINAYWQPPELRLPSMLPATQKSLAAAHRHVSRASLGNSSGRHTPPVESPTYLVQSRSLGLLSAESIGSTSCGG